jgi:hypothetical protein
LLVVLIQTTIGESSPSGIAAAEKSKEQTGNRRRRALSVFPADVPLSSRLSRSCQLIKNEYMNFTRTDPRPSGKDYRSAGADSGFGGNDQPLAELGVAPITPVGLIRLRPDTAALLDIGFDGRDRMLLADSFRETVAQYLQIIAGLGCNLQGGLYSEPEDGDLRPKNRATRSGPAIKEGRTRQVIHQLSECIDRGIVGYG